MQPLPDVSPTALVGPPKTAIPKLKKPEISVAKRLLSESPNIDPVFAVRLALASKQRLDILWKSADILDMALSTADISRRFAEISDSQTWISAVPAITVLERRSKFAPGPVFRALQTLSKPRIRKAETSNHLWDEETAKAAMNLTLRLVKPLLENRGKSKRSLPEQMLEIAERAVLSHRSAALSVLGVRLVAELEHAAGWMAMESSNLKRMIASLSEMPSSLVPNLLQTAAIAQMASLSEELKKLPHAERHFRTVVASEFHSRGADMPIPSRVWATGYLDPECKELPVLDPDQIMSSGASMERLALVLVSSWDARNDGQSASRTFSTIEAVMSSGFHLSLAGQLGKPVVFDPSMHECSQPVMTGESVMLIRPWVEHQRRGEIEILIKGIVKPNLITSGAPQ